MSDIFGIVIVRPFGLALTALYNVIGSYGIAVILFALIVKLLFLVLSTVGWTNMWAATFADVGVAVIAILNAMRAGKKQ